MVLVKEKIYANFLSVQPQAVVALEHFFHVPTGVLGISLACQWTLWRNKILQWVVIRLDMDLGEKSWSCQKKTKLKSICRESPPSSHNHTSKENKNMWQIQNAVNRLKPDRKSQTMSPLIRVGQLMSLSTNQISRNLFYFTLRFLFRRTVFRLSQLLFKYFIAFRE